jgi:transposase
MAERHELNPTQESAVTEATCKKCQSAEHVKNGKVRGMQRYRCKACGCNFTATPAHREHPAKKSLALLLYGMGNMSFRMIGRLLGVSHVSAFEWIKAEATKLPQPEMPADIELVNLDEMWHFLKKRAKNSGCSGPLILLSGAFYPGCWGAVMLQPAKGFSIKSASKAARS